MLGKEHTFTFEKPSQKNSQWKKKKNTDQSMFLILISTFLERKQSMSNSKNPSITEII